MEPMIAKRRSKMHEQIMPHIITNCVLVHDFEQF